MKIANMSLLVTALAASTIGACATTAPPQLLEARDAYAVSNNGLAAKLTPTDLYDAKKALDSANKEFEENGDTPTCRDYAYIASRKLELADVKARTEQDRQRIAEAVRAGVVVRDSQVKSTETALAATRERLKDERRENSSVTKELRDTNNAQTQALQKTAADLETEKQARTTAAAQLETEKQARTATAAQLETEKQARIAAEGKLAGAMKDLAAIAAVKEEARGVVITLSGSVLFASGKYALLNTAMTKLDQVAEALKAQDSDKRMVVEGHTDSQGPESINQPLSLNRATAVRDYLVSRGVDPNKISSIGMSSSRPITDNRTPENRANNRRVEIVIGRPPMGFGG